MHFHLNDLILSLFLLALLTIMCECRDMSMDVKTPRNVYLSAFYKRSFAYHTVKHRLPVILTQLLDNLVRNKEEIYKEYGEGASDDLKKAIGEISKLKYEIQTNKPLTNLTSDEPDVHFFNEYISKQATEEGHTTYFNTIWLLTECYMYRRIKEIFFLTNTLKDFDYFQSSKREAFENSLPLISSLAQLAESNGSNKIDKEEHFISMLKANLWGNKCDLSITLGKTDAQGKLSNTNLLEAFILSNHSEKIWEAISAKSEDDEIVDIVLDNSGYEVFTDCCLAEYLIEQNLAKKIRFYVKAIPWFISDVMKHDFHWIISELKNSSNVHLNAMGNRWGDFVNAGTWEIVVSTFWTLPFEFKFMKTVDPDLYKKLSEAKLIFFKGDLNYRKLFGEINWDPIAPIEDSLQGFHPSKLAILRTIKADIVVGLAPGIAEQCEAKDNKWMEKGDYGLIQFCDKIVKIQENAH